MPQPLEEAEEVRGELVLPKVAVIAAPYSHRTRPEEAPPTAGRRAQASPLPSDSSSSQSHFHMSVNPPRPPSPTGSREMVEGPRTTGHTSLTCAAACTGYTR